MSSDRILAELSAHDRPSPALLQSAVEAAADLSPHVIDALERLAGGRCPSPSDARLISNGIYVMAAARRREALRPLLRALATPEPELTYVFGDSITMTLPAIALSLFGGEPEPIIEAIENRAVDGFVRWSLFNALTRLALDGAISRERMIAVIDRFDRDRLAGDHDPAWEGWFDAILWLDLGSHADRVRAAARDGRGPERKVDVAAWEEDAGKLGTGTGPSRDFENPRYGPITDVVAAAGGFLPELEDGANESDGEPDPNGRHEELEDGAADDEENLDPAAGIALTDAERHWLRMFLGSRQVPEGTLSLAQLDGFLSAIVVGPAVVPPEIWNEMIWGDGGSAGAFADPAQAEFVGGLLDRHARSIAMRLDGSFGHEPLVAEADSPTAFADWAAGFLRAMEFSAHEWRPMLEDRRSRDLLCPILFAGTGDEALYRGRAVPPDGEELLIEMADALWAVRAYWAQPPERRGPQKPIRIAPKPGRNQPCPCGSGRKYKRCCGSGLGAANS